MYELKDDAQRCLETLLSNACSSSSTDYLTDSLSQLSLLEAKQSDEALFRLRAIIETSKRTHIHTDGEAAGAEEWVLDVMDTLFALKWDRTMVAPILQLFDSVNEGEWENKDAEDVAKLILKSLSGLLSVDTVCNVICTLLTIAAQCDTIEGITPLLSATLSLLAKATRMEGEDSLTFLYNEIVNALSLSPFLERIKEIFFFSLSFNDELLKALSSSQCISLVHLLLAIEEAERRKFVEHDTDYSLERSFPRPGSLHDETSTAADWSSAMCECVCHVAEVKAGDAGTVADLRRGIVSFLKECALSPRMTLSLFDNLLACSRSGRKMHDGGRRNNDLLREFFAALSLTQQTHLLTAFANTLVLQSFSSLSLLSSPSSPTSHQQTEESPIRVLIDLVFVFFPLCADALSHSSEHEGERVNIRIEDQCEDAQEWREREMEHISSAILCARSGMSEDDFQYLLRSCAECAQQHHAKEVVEEGRYVELENTTPFTSRSIDTRKERVSAMAHSLRRELAQRVLSGIVSQTDSLDLSVAHTVLSVGSLLPQALLNSLFDTLSLALCTAQESEQEDALCDLLLTHLSSAHLLRESPHTHHTHSATKSISIAQSGALSKLRERLRERLRRQLGKAWVNAFLSGEAHNKCLSLPITLSLPLSPWLCEAVPGKCAVDPMLEKLVGLALCVERLLSSDVNSVHTLQDAVDDVAMTQPQVQEGQVGRDTQQEVEREWPDMEDLYSGGRNSLRFLSHSLLTQFLALSCAVKHNISLCSMSSSEPPSAREEIFAQQVSIFLLFSLIAQCHYVKASALEYKEQTKTVGDLDIDDEIENDREDLFLSHSSKNGLVDDYEETMEIVSFLDIQRLLLREKRRMHMPPSSGTITHFGEAFSVPHSLASETALSWLEQCASFFQSESQQPQVDNDLSRSQFALFWESQLAALAHSSHLLNTALLREEKFALSQRNPSFHLNMIVTNLFRIFYRRLSLAAQRDVECRLFTALPPAPHSSTPHKRNHSQRQKQQAVSSATPPNERETARYLQNFNGLHRLAHLFHLLTILRTPLRSQSYLLSPIHAHKQMSGLTEGEDTCPLASPSSSSSDESDVDGWSAFKVKQLRISGDSHKTSVGHAALLSGSNGVSQCERLFASLSMFCLSLNERLHPLRGRTVVGGHRFLHDVVREISAECADLTAHSVNGALDVRSLKGLSCQSLFSTARHEILSAMCTALRLLIKAEKDIDVKTETETETETEIEVIRMWMSMSETIMEELFALTMEGIVLRLFKMYLKSIEDILTMIERKTNDAGCGKSQHDLLWVAFLLLHCLPKVKNLSISFLGRIVQLSIRISEVAGCQAPFLAYLLACAMKHKCSSDIDYSKQYAESTAEQSSKKHTITSSPSKKKTEHRKRKTSLFLDDSDVGEDDDSDTAIDLMEDNMTTTADNDNRQADVMEWKDTLFSQYCEMKESFIVMFRARFAESPDELVVHSSIIVLRDNKLADTVLFEVICALNRSLARYAQEWEVLRNTSLINSSKMFLALQRNVSNLSNVFSLAVSSFYRENGAHFPLLDAMDSRTFNAFSSLLSLLLQELSVETKQLPKVTADAEPLITYFPEIDEQTGSLRQIEFSRVPLLAEALGLIFNEQDDVEDSDMEDALTVKKEIPSLRRSILHSVRFLVHQKNGRKDATARVRRSLLKASMGVRKLNTLIKRVKSFVQHLVSCASTLINKEVTMSPDFHKFADESLQLCNEINEEMTPVIQDQSKEKSNRLLKSVALKLSLGSHSSEGDEDEPSNEDFRFLDGNKKKSTRKQKRLRSRNKIVDEWLGEGEDDEEFDTYADLEDFIV